MQEPQISVVMPAYNSAAFVRRAIESVWAQTHTPIELIVVDDGSKDDTAAVAAAVDPRTIVIRQENGGPGAARNRGVKAARGNWIAFIDADDAWRPRKLELQRPHMLRPEIDIVFSHVVNPLARDHVVWELTFDDLWRHNYVGLSTSVVRRTAFEGIGGFDEDRGILGIEDYNLWLRLASRGSRFAFVTDELVEYTPAPGNLSSNYWKIAQSAAKNAEKVAEFSGMDPARLSAKLAGIYEEYGVALLYKRDLKGARTYLRQSLRHRMDRRNAVRWLTTFAPKQVLDLRRNLARSVSNFLS
ncbi:MAG TPA: glycosyltransferase family A protein [Caulifigura sp.]|nr:glycosyltransferase family A protein [Caulifigura sp.]